MTVERSDGKLVLDVADVYDQETNLSKSLKKIVIMESGLSLWVVKGGHFLPLQGISW